MYVQKQSHTEYYPTETYTLSKDFTFTTASLRGNRDIRFNPKLISTDYFQLALESADGQRFDYDAQKLNLKTFRFRYTSPLTPDLTKGYLRAEIPNDNGVFTRDTMTNLTGLIFSCDDSMIYTSSAWDEFMVNNKNFALSMQLERDFDVKRADTALIMGNVNAGMQMIGGGIQLASGNPAGLSGLLGGASSAASNFVNHQLQREGIELAQTQKLLSLDNMSASPNSLKNASGNTYFTAAITKHQLFICEYEALPHELKIADDDMYLNGYTYNVIGNLKDFWNIRKYFNFVRAQIRIIGGLSLSNERRNNLRDRFAMGVRFWKSDTVQYNLENYENIAA
jgi:hypothetical protein